jgi:hypothetical protein
MPTRRSLLRSTAALPAARLAAGAAQGNAVKDFVPKGDSALFYHNVTYISPNNQGFRDVLGAVAPGHTISALWNPEYEKLQKNAAHWLLRQKGME